SPNALSLLQGNGGTSTISTTVTAGSAGTVNLAVSGAPTGASATLSPTSVTAGGASTLTVGAGAAAPGSYPLTVTGTEGARVHSTTVALTIPANDFSISAGTPSFSLVQGGTGSGAILTSVTSGIAQTVSLAAGVAPGGPIVSVAPASVVAGGSATLNIDSGSAAPGSYTITVTGTEGTFVHAASVSLTITAPVVNDFSISAGPDTLTLQQGAGGSSLISTVLASGSAE